MLGRRKCIKWAAAALATTALVSAASADESKGFGFSIDKASSGTEVPKVSMSLGMRPVANDLIYVSGIKQGFFKDVGITVTPEPFGRKVLPDQAIPLLVNKQVDAQTTYPPDVIAAMDTVQNVRFIAFSDLFQGFAVLANPKSGAKTVGQFMKEGMPFAEALKKTMAQLKGKSFATAPQIDNRIFLDIVFKSGEVDMSKDTKLIITPDGNALQLASGNKIDFASPDGAPFTAQLRGAGWIPLVSPLDVLTNMPAVPGSPAAALVGTPGVAADADWARSNPETVLRLVSVMFRIIEQEQKQPDVMLGAMLSYVNAFAGTSLDLAGLKLTIDALSPLSNFEFQKNYCEKTDSTLYYKTAFNAQVKFNTDKGILTGSSYDPANLIWSCDVYEDLAALKKGSDEMMLKFEGKTLATNQQAELTKARQYYAWYDYLDAYRLLKAMPAS